MKVIVSKPNLLFEMWDAMRATIVISFHFTRKSLNISNIPFARKVIMQFAFEVCCWDAWGEQHPQLTSHNDHARGAANHPTLNHSHRASNQLEKWVTMHLCVCMCVWQREWHWDCDSHIINSEAWANPLYTHNLHINHKSTPCSQNKSSCLSD